MIPITNLSLSSVLALCRSEYIIKEERFNNSFNTNFSILSSPLIQLMFCKYKYVSLLRSIFAHISNARAGVWENVDRSGSGERDRKRDRKESKRSEKSKERNRREKEEKKIREERERREIERRERAEQERERRRQEMERREKVSFMCNFK